MREVLDVGGFRVSESSRGVRRGRPRVLGDAVMEILEGRGFEYLRLAGLEASFKGIEFLAWLLNAR